MQNTKLYIYVTNLEEALNDDFSWSLTLSSRDDLNGGTNNWTLIQEIDVDLNINREALTDAAVDSLENEIKDIRAATTAAITLLEARQQNLLALTHQS